MEPSSQPRPSPNLCIPWPPAFTLLQGVEQSPLLPQQGRTAAPAGPSVKQDFPEAAQSGLQPEGPGYPDSVPSLQSSSVRRCCSPWPRLAFPQAGTSIGAQNVTAGIPEPKVPPSCSAGADPAQSLPSWCCAVCRSLPSPEQSSCSLNRYPGTALRAQGLFPKAPPKQAVLPFIPSLLSMGHPTVNRALSARTSGSCLVNAGWACLWGSHLTPAVLGVQGGSSGLGLPSASLCTSTSPVPLGL